MLAHAWATHRSLVRFVWRFALIFVLLIIPWPGWNKTYDHYFRALGELAFSRDDNKRLVRFTAPPEQPGHPELTTQMTLGNRDLMGANGTGLGEVVDLDTRSIGWVPTALTASLILATPIRWRRKAWAMFWGLLLVHGFILFSLQMWIWNEEPELSLLTLSPLAKQIVDDTQYLLITQLGASFSVPVLIWLLVSFRREDFSAGKTRTASREKIRS